MRDPLASLDVKVQSFDVKRVASVYFDAEGIRCWTKAWFDNRSKGESAVPISRESAIAFINGKIDKDRWLTRYFSVPMSVYRNCISKTEKELLDGAKYTT